MTELNPAFDIRMEGLALRTRNQVRQEASPAVIMTINQDFDERLLDIAHIMPLELEEPRQPLTSAMTAMLNRRDFQGMRARMRVRGMSGDITVEYWQPPQEVMLDTTLPISTPSFSAYELTHNLLVPKYDLMVYTYSNKLRERFFQVRVGQNTYDLYHNNSGPMFMVENNQFVEVRVPANPSLLASLQITAF